MPERAADGIVLVAGVGVGSTRRMLAQPDARGDRGATDVTLAVQRGAAATLAATRLRSSATDTGLSRQTQPWRVR